MRKCVLTLLAIVLCLTVSAYVSAADTQKEVKGSIHPASKILGMEIRNSKNDSLGYVEDCVLNMKDGKAVYVVMSRGKVLGFGGNYFAIAPDALSLAANGEYLMLEANNSDFENAKGFDQNNWPTQPDRRWGKSSSTARTDEQPTGNNKSYDNMARVTAITGLPVYGRDASDKTKEAQVGRVYDLALDCNKHQVAYVAVHHGGTLGVGGKLVAVPWQALTLRAPALDPQRRAFFIDATTRNFDEAPGFTSDNWPAMPDSRFNNLRRDGQ
jgi:sporulation protein YlmC with PRC-barrel domain